MSARLRLTLSYAIFLVGAGAVVLAGVYVVLRYVPSYPLPSGDLSQFGAVPASRDHILSRLLLLSAVALVVLAAIGLVGGWLLAGWILRPLHDINAAARIAATGRLDYRIALVGRSDEFAELADNFDHMLDRLHDAFQTQERFAANASHELRTPLAVMATLLDVAQRDPERRYDPELLERLRITNARAIGLTEALLRLADANAVTAVSESVDLAEIVAVAVDELGDDAARRQVVLHAALRTAPTEGDATLLTQLATNLVQNAIRHNDVAGEAWIMTGADATGLQAILRVENTGPVVTAAAATQLAEPFLRGAGRTAGGGEERGYGLGLALVARIVAVHDGTLAIAPRAGGGLVVTVCVPWRALSRFAAADEGRHAVAAQRPRGM